MTLPETELRLAGPEGLFAVPLNLCIVLNALKFPNESRRETNVHVVYLHGSVY